MAVSNSTTTPLQDQVKELQKIPFELYEAIAGVKGIGTMLHPLADTEDRVRQQIAAGLVPLADYAIQKIEAMQVMIEALLCDIPYQPRELTQGVCNEH